MAINGRRRDELQTPRIQQGGPCGEAHGVARDYFDASFDAEEDALVFRRLAGREPWLAVLKKFPVSPDDVPPRRRARAKRRKL